MIRDPQGTLLAYLRDRLLPRGAAVDAETSLFGGRLLDSLRLVELVGFVEKTFGVRVSPLELVLENFDTVERMTDYLARKGIRTPCNGTA